MQKIWKKTGPWSYTLLVDGVDRGSLAFTHGRGKTKALITCEGAHFELYALSWWRSIYILRDANGLGCAELRPESWYGHTFKITFNNTNYRLVLRNNPLAGWALIHNGQTLLSYTLGQPVHTQHASVPVLFDFLIWYFFAPVAIEHQDSDLLLLTLL